MMRWVWLPVLPFGVFACAWITGTLLDPNFRVGISMEVLAPPEAVYAVLSSVENYPQWRDDVIKVEADALNPEIFWIEHYKDGGETEFDAGGGHPSDKWEAHARRSNLPMVGTRTFLLVPMGNGSTRIAASEEGTVANPLARLKYRFVSGHAERLKTLLLDLRRRLAD